MKKNYDVIIIGAGSVGVPIALSLAEEKFSVLVIDKLPSPGQGQNKKAIGGIRATHSDKAKIHISLESIEIFSAWKAKYGDDIEWQANGYSFPAYTDEHEKMLKDLLKIQKNFGLNIDWISSDEYLELVPGICKENLHGSTFSPEDGSASPLLSLNAFYFKSKEFGAEYHFNEEVISTKNENSKISSIVTNRGEYNCEILINAAGNNAKEIGEMAGVKIPVQPDSHEGGITEPVQRFFKPMVVDLRPGLDSQNYYFYQNTEGQVVFCITPEPPIEGTDSRSTSVYLPQVSRRMIELFPKLKNIKVRRTWRGQYPATPDGFPIIGKTEIEGFVLAVGMCGQGFMLGPGIGKLIARLMTNNLSKDDNDNLNSLNLYRNFGEEEKFK
ncbi:MAG: FAD-binding oxidoreductase [Candidatus Cloacimonadota bacterium]|nr:FAD-binding oxidoreductase [Candidatus Cloacimonadota bacterium]